MKAIGEEASWGYEKTGIGLRFKVTSIEAIECDGYGAQPTGTALAVALEIATEPDFLGPISVNDVPDQISFQPHYWRGYEPDGTRMNSVDTGIGQNCLADRSRLVPGYFGKGEKIKGLVILDVSTPTGTIVADPAGGGGWAWNY